MLKSTFSLLVLALLFPALALGQSASLAAGARVRLTSPADQLEKHVTTVTEMRGDSIVVAGRSGSRIIALRNVTALDISTGTRNRVVRDGLIGFGAGALIGAVVGADAADECSDQAYCISPFDSGGEAAALGIVVFGAAGLVAGAIVGAFDRTDRWEPRELPFKVAVNPSMSGGVTLKISRAF